MHIIICWATIASTWLSITLFSWIKSSVTTREPALNVVFVSLCRQTECLCVCVALCLSVNLSVSFTSILTCTFTYLGISSFYHYCTFKWRKLFKDKSSSGFSGVCCTVDLFTFSAGLKLCQFIQMPAHTSWHTGLRIVDFAELAKQLHCHKCSSVLDLNHIQREERYGLASVLFISCHCGAWSDVHTSGRVNSKGTTVYSHNRLLLSSKQCMHSDFAHIDECVWPWQQTLPCFRALTCRSSQLCKYLINNLHAHLSLSLSLSPSLPPSTPPPPPPPHPLHLLP